MEELTTRLDNTGKAIQLKLKERRRLEGYLVAIDEECKPLPDQPEKVTSYVSLSDEELEEQFQALSASDKLRYCYIVGLGPNCKFIDLLFKCLVITFIKINFLNCFIVSEIIYSQTDTLTEELMYLR